MRSRSCLSKGDVGPLWYSHQPLQDGVFAGRVGFQEDLGRRQVTEGQRIEDRRQADNPVCHQPVDALAGGAFVGARPPGDVGSRGARLGVQCLDDKIIELVERSFAGGHLMVPFRNYVVPILCPRYTNWPACVCTDRLQAALGQRARRPPPGPAGGYTRHSPVKSCLGRYNRVGKAIFAGSFDHLAGRLEEIANF